MSSSGAVSSSIGLGRQLACHFQHGGGPRNDMQCLRVGFGSASLAPFCELPGGAAECITPSHNHRCNWQRAILQFGMGSLVLGFALTIAGPPRPWTATGCKPPSPALAALGCPRPHAQNLRMVVASALSGSPSGEAAVAARHLDRCRAAMDTMDGWMPANTGRRAEPLLLLQESYGGEYVRRLRRARHLRQIIKRRVQLARPCRQTARAAPQTHRVAMRTAAMR